MSSDEKKPLHPEAFKKGKEEKIDEKKSQKVSKTFKALADPTRLKILTALSKQELCVHDLSKLLKMSQSAISHQLTVLKNAKIVKFRKKGRRISDRTKEADEREELGHWEMDLLEGKKGKDDPFLLVLTERLSRKEIIEKIPDKTQESVIKGLDRIERRIGVRKFRKLFKTITTDNGREFYDYEGTEESFTKSNIPRTEHYYADAYCSWQRGSNENLNKMIRRFIPKGRSLKKYSQKAIKKIQRWMNNYPRKMFNFKSAGKVYQQVMAAN